jgi:hypothetical protein
MYIIDAIFPPLYWFRYLAATTYYWNITAASIGEEM